MSTLVLHRGREKICGFLRKISTAFLRKFVWAVLQEHPDSLNDYANAEKMDVWKGSEQSLQQQQHSKGKRLRSCRFVLSCWGLFTQMQSTMDVTGWTRQLTASLTVTNSVKIAENYCEM